ncbi:heterokaryon incompatibility protein-domain-containing protein [Tricladium varicosporioides]|nr:heterokaryon incompatibility protein-domain-containing protein [Hymenoscyphus varicosporioides]
MRAEIRPGETLCKRCERLDVTSLLQTTGSENGFKNFKNGGSDARRDIRSLGSVAEVAFFDDCPVCRCLFIISPTPEQSSQEVLLFASLTLYRVKGLDATASGAKSQYAKCLQVVLWPPSFDFNLEDPSSDAMCILEDCWEGDQTTEKLDGAMDKEEFRLGGRALDSRGYSLDIFKSWLERCERLHPATCQRLWAEGLKEISLVDVHSRKVVKYPEGECDYVALSYVWGDIQQPPVEIGSTLEELPQTIEDAISFVKELGKRYLWVDSLCINQGREDHKSRQIGLMCSIYQGAYATIVALSGRSSTTGLPRVNPQVETYDQFSCVIDGKRLVTLMPTLSQLIWVSPWGSRAWTFQEALLSPRCFYFTQHQVYFECNAMTCCESLEESQSHIHNLYWDDAFINKEKPEAKYGKGVLRNPFVGESRRPERLVEYGNLLTLYSYRAMTNDYDAINAFSGILQALTQNLYPKGFFWGLPIEHFNFGLMWTARSEARRRSGFPSWSWAGWEGPRWPQVPDDGVDEKDLLIQPYLRISHFNNDKIELLFESESKYLEDAISTDPIASPNLHFEADKALDLSNALQLKLLGFLHIKGVFLRFTPCKYVPPANGSWQEDRQVSTTLKGQQIPILYVYSGEELESRLGRVQDFILLARETMNEYIVFRLLMVDIQTDRKVAYRVAPIKLWVLKSLLSVVEDATPIVRTILLA